MEELRENFNKDLENTRNNKSELKSTITEIKNMLEGINSRLDNTEERTSDLEDRIMEITQPEQQKEKQILKNGSNLRDLWENIKHTNIRIIEVPEGKGREKGIENVFDEIMAKNFQN